MPKSGSRSQRHLSQAKDPLEAEGMIGALRLQTVLEELREGYNRHLRGHDIARMTPSILDEVAALTEAFRFLVETIQPETPLEVVRRELLRVARTEEVRSRIARVCPPLKLSGDDLRRTRRNEGLKQTQPGGALHYEMGGNDFFKNYDESTRPTGGRGLTFENNRNLVDCEANLTQRQGKNYSVCVNLMLLCLGGDAITTTRVMQAQTQGWMGEVARQEERENFFEEFLRFITVYADVSQHLIEQSNPGVAGALQQRSRQVLKEILMDNRLQVVSREGMPRASLFSLLQERFTTDPSRQSPWFMGDPEKIPFAPEKIGTLIRRSIPRQAFADVMVELNDHDYRSAVREIRHFLTTYKAIRTPTGDQEKKFNAWCNTLIQKAGLDIDPMQTLREKIDQLEARFTELTEAISTLDPRVPEDQHSKLERRIDHLIRHHRLPIAQGESLETKLALLRATYGVETEPMRNITRGKGKMSGMRLHVEALLIRLLDVKKIFEREDLQKEVAALMDSIGQKIEELRKWDPKKRAMLGLSIKQTLTQEGSAEDQGRLDVPLGGMRNRSLRHHLAGLARATLTAEEIALGFEGEEGTVIPTVDQESLEMTKDDIPLSKNFDIAGPQAPRRRRLHRAGRALVSRFPRAKAFDRVVEFVSTQANEYFNSKDKEGRDTFLYFPYNSGTAAWKTDLVHSLLGDCTEEDLVLITNQEYGPITEGQKPQVKVMYLNEPEGEDLKALDEETVFQKLEATIDHEKTKLIALSSQTRFGDRLCGKEGREAFEKLCRRLKKAYPHIPLLVDGCQSIGRGQPDDLKAIGADFYLISGAKAHGVKGCGLLGISKAYLAKSIPDLEGKLQELGIITQEKTDKKIQPERLLSHDTLRRLKERGVHPKFRYDPGTMDPDEIAAMGIGLNLLRGIDDGFRIEGNHDAQRSQRLDLKIANRMSQLTHHAIEKAKQYGASFKATSQGWIPDIPTEGAHDPYGCEIIYPAHRNPKSYNGILTIAFPSMNGAQLAERLGKKGYQVHPCLEKMRGIRISFHYLHETKDVDGLFEAIQTIQSEVIQERMHQGIEHRNKKARDWLPDYRQAAA